MIEYVISLLIGLLALGLQCTLAMWGLFWLMRHWDMLNGVSFRETVYPVILESPAAAADYHGKRFMGCCIIAAAAILKLAG